MKDQNPMICEIPQSMIDALPPLPTSGDPKDDMRAMMAMWEHAWTVVLPQLRQRAGRMYAKRQNEAVMRLLFGEKWATLTRIMREGPTKESIVDLLQAYG